jgi:hypothetical protein
LVAAVDPSRRRLSAANKLLRGITWTRGSRQCSLFASPTSPSPVRHRQSSAASTVRLAEPYTAVITFKVASLPWLSSFGPLLRFGVDRARNRAPQLVSALHRCAAAHRYSPPGCRRLHATPAVGSRSDGSDRIHTWVNLAAYWSTRAEPCRFARKLLCFLLLQADPSLVLRPLPIGAFLYGLDPRLPVFSGRGPDLKFYTVDLLFIRIIMFRPSVSCCFAPVDLVFLQIGPCILF